MRGCWVSGWVGEWVSGWVSETDMRSHFAGVFC